MSAHHHATRIPRGVLITVAAMLVLCIGLAAGARRARLAAPPPPAQPVRSEIGLRFADRPDGAIAVLEAASGRELDAIAPRSDGFIRGVLRGLLRARRIDSLDREAPFVLARVASGRLLLSDPLTGRRIDLDSFGPTNAAAFARFLEPHEVRP